jgi:2-furoyl-CoA dehydrogenase FAD binding subunit
MKPAAFDYYRAESLREALELRAEKRDALRIIAGGQSLGAMLNLRLVSPGELLDISRLDELKRIEARDGHVEVGAAVTQSQLLDWAGLRERLPFVAQALPWVGHFQTRNRGTIGGSICHGDPSSELPLALALLGGEVVIRARRGSRRMSAADFQLGMLTNACEDDEIVVAVSFPAGVGARGSAFREVARRHGDFAIVAVGLVVLDSGRVRLGVAGLADTPQVLEVPGDIDHAAFVEQVEAFAWRLKGHTDIHASARYRRDLLRRIAPQLLSEVRQCA